MSDSNIISVNFGAKGQEGGASGEGYDYDRKCEVMRERNQQFLDLFEADMRKSGLAESTIRRHFDNVDFYINEYLLYYGVNDMESGCHDIYGFLGDFFIRKCAWSTPGTIKTNATSIKKFYKCMRDNGLVSAEAYDDLVRTIKNNMEDWQADCAEFNDPSNDPFFMGNDPDELLLDLFRSELAKRLGLSADELDALFSDDALGDGSDFELSPEGEWSAELPEGGRPEEPPAPTLEQVVDVFTLALFYLTSWTERVGGKRGFMERKAWKSADWGALDRLREMGFVSCSNKAKSVTITADGASEAELFLRSLGLEHLLDGNRN